MGLNNLEQLS